MSHCFRFFPCWVGSGRHQPRLFGWLILRRWRLDALRHGGGCCVVLALAGSLPAVAASTRLATFSASVAGGPKIGGEAVRTSFCSVFIISRGGRAGRVSPVCARGELPGRVSASASFVMLPVWGGSGRVVVSVLPSGFADWSGRSGAFAGAAECRTAPSGCAVSAVTVAFIAAPLRASGPVSSGNRRPVVVEPGNCAAAGGLERNSALGLAAVGCCLGWAGAGLAELFC